MSATTTELARLIENMTPNSTVLDLRGYGLETLPEDIGTLTHLTKLDLNGNRLTSLPESIGNLTNLTELYLNGHRLTTLPESIGNLTNLTRLDLNGDTLELLPDSISNLTKLTELNLNGNRLDRIPDFIFHLSGLEKINLDDNLLTDISNLKNIPNLKIHRSCTRAKFKLIILKNNVRFVVGDRYLAERILSDLRSFTNLVSVSIGSYGSRIVENRDTCQILSVEGIEEILFDLGKLPKLCWLTWHINLFAYHSIVMSSFSPYDVSFYGISLCRYQFNKIRSLEHLYIQENIWTNLSLLRQLPNLKGISLIGLNRTTLRRSIKNLDIINNLVNLKKLLIYGCKSRNTIDMVKDMIGLECLILNNNQLTSLSNSLVNLNKLDSLQIHNNPIVDLSILIKLKTLKTLYFNGVILPRRYWTNLSEWKAEWLLDENNIEIRRRIIDLVGYEKICKELKALTLDSWQEYTLLRIDYVEPIFDRYRRIINREPIALLKMTCPSTGHVHILRVPPEMTSAEEAIVWVNHGIHPDRFAIQT
jgi:leucine-rich repeat protein SHOC2